MHDETIKNAHRCSRTLSILCPILIKLQFPDRFSENAQVSNFTKIRPVAAQLFHTDVRTDGRM